MAKGKPCHKGSLPEVKFQYALGMPLWDFPSVGNLNLAICVYIYLLLHSVTELEGLWNLTDQENGWVQSLSDIGTSSNCCLWIIDLCPKLGLGKNFTAFKNIQIDVDVCVFCILMLCLCVCCCIYNKLD